MKVSAQSTQNAFSNTRIKGVILSISMKVDLLLKPFVITAIRAEVNAVLIQKTGRRRGE